MSTTSRLPGLSSFYQRGEPASAGLSFLFLHALADSAFESGQYRKCKHRPPSSSLLRTTPPELVPATCFQPHLLSYSNHRCPSLNHTNHPLHSTLEFTSTVVITFTLVLVLSSSSESSCTFDTVLHTDAKFVALSLLVKLNALVARSWAV